MRMKLAVEDLSVESFSVAPGDSVGIQSTSSLAPTFYGCSCGCGTFDGCPSADPRCTELCIIESGKTDWHACCG